MKHTHRWQGQTLEHDHGGDEVVPNVAPGAPEHVRISLHGYFGHIQDTGRDEGALEPREFGIPMVWDVTASSYEEAAEHLVRVFRQDGGLLPSIRHLDDREHQVESWWFPEGRIKHLDGNDNEPFRLVLDTGQDEQLRDALTAVADASGPDSDSNDAEIDALRAALEIALGMLDVTTCDTCFNPHMDSERCPNLKRTCLNCCGEGDH